MKDSTAGAVIIVDWKRSRKISMENAHSNLKYPLDHIPESNYWLYSLQVSSPLHMHFS